MGFDLVVRQSQELSGDELLVTRGSWGDLRGPSKN